MYQSDGRLFSVIMTKGIRSELLDAVNAKGRVLLPNRMNFRKGSKRQLTPPLRMVPISGNHVHAFHAILYYTIHQLIVQLMCILAS